MRRRLLYCFALSLVLLLLASCASLRTAATLDEQLARLHAFSLVCGARFETGGWDVDLDIDPAEDFPEGFLPAAGSLHG